MSVCRSDVGVGVLDGVLYAVGGYDGLNHLSSVETYRPSTGVWTSITDMHFPRRHAGISCCLIILIFCNKMFVNILNLS